MSEAGTTPCPVAQWALERPEGVALRTTSGEVTWAEWHRRTIVVAERLRDAGVEASTRVGLCLRPSEEYLTLLVAIFRLGAVACPVNPQFPADYRRVLLEQLDCALVIDADELARLRDGFVFAADSEKSAFPTWLLDQPATILFTSGSTGSPKAAVLSLRNHLESARMANANLPLHSGDAWLLSLPLFHVAGFGVLFRCLVAGASIVLSPSEMPLHAAVTELGVTHVSLVARQLARLVDVGAWSPSLKAILLGGSAIPAPLLDRAVAAGLPVYTSYGMTETASQIAATPPGAARAELASSGRPLAAATLRATADGVLQVNGPSRFLGYWRRDGLECPFDSDGWFTTSDLGYFDTAGLLHVRGRRDNVFIAGGENIQPEEIERALCALPGVAQAIVVPVPHPEFGATPVAFVDCDGAIDEERLRDGLLDVLPRFKAPRHFLPWPAEMTDTGMKISRSALAEKAAAWGRTAADSPRRRQ